jgi:oligoribonuclease NrnB/cAMP/cGMP phosphodiesterase (DHH superfamily)
LNDLLYLIGQSKFIARFTENVDPAFTDGENLVLDIEDAKIQKYIESKGKELHKDVINGDTVGVVFAEQYISQLGNELSKQNADLDYIVIIQAGKGLVSYRTIHDHVNVAEIAKSNGGGGHPKASGSSFDTKYSVEFIHRVFGG